MDEKKKLYRGEDGKWLSEIYSQRYLDELDDMLAHKRQRTYTTSPFVGEFFDMLEADGYRRPYGADIFASSRPYRANSWGYIVVSHKPSCIPCIPIWAGECRYGRAGNMRVPQKIFYEDFVCPRALPDIEQTYATYLDTIYVISNSHVLDILKAAGEHEMYCASDDEPLACLVVSPRYLEQHPEANEIIESAACAGKVVDEREYMREGLISRIDTNGRTSWHWNGETPDRIVEELCVNRIFYAVTSMRNGLFPKYAGDEPAINFKVPVVSAVANALMRGAGELSFHHFNSGRADSPTPATMMLSRNIHLMNDNMSAASRELLKETEKLEEIARLWKYAYAQTATKCGLDFEPQQYADAAFMEEAIATAAEALGMNDYIRVWKSGVPVDDIVA